MRRTCLTLLVGILSCSMLFTETALADSALQGSVKAGEALYAPCKTCHGDKAGGNQTVGAPALANQTDWYLQRQLLNFRSGVRGQVAADSYGGQMRAMAMVLKDEQAVADVVAYLKSLAPVSTKVTLKGDVRNGKDYYNMVCGGCHGPDASGNAALQAPALKGTDDWYLKRQFMGFRDGLRGTHVEDKYGKQMKAMTKALPNEKVIDDVMSYIRTLEK